MNRKPPNILWFLVAAVRIDENRSPLGKFGYGR